MLKIKNILISNQNTNPKTNIQKHYKSKLEILSHLSLVDFWCRTLVIARERKREEILCNNF